MIAILGPGVLAQLSYPKQERIILKISMMIRDTGQCLVQMGILLELQKRKIKKRFIFRYKLTLMVSAYSNHRNTLFVLYISQ